MCYRSLLKNATNPWETHFKIHYSKISYYSLLKGHLGNTFEGYCYILDICRFIFGSHGDIFHKVHVHDTKKLHSDTSFHASQCHKVTNKNQKEKSLTGKTLLLPTFLENGHFWPFFTIQRQYRLQPCVLSWRFYGVATKYIVWTFYSTRLIEILLWKKIYWASRV